MLGLILTGSAARTGMATEHSDVDVYVIVEPSACDRWTTSRSAAIDQILMTVADITSPPGPDDPGGAWNRYSFTHAQVLLDRLDGDIKRMTTAQGTLSDAEARVVLDAYLDGYLNFAYRSLKADRDGRPFERRLDAVESMPYALTAVFALEGRVRPYNKYLAWELEQHPLSEPAWRSDVLVPALEQMMSAGSPEAQRWLFASVDQVARAHPVHGRRCAEIIEDWGSELALLRGER